MLANTIAMRRNLVIEDISVVIVEAKRRGGYYSTSE
jgi:hypothetical protein